MIGGGGGLAASAEERIAVAIIEAKAIPGRPGKVTFRLRNHCAEPLEFIKSAVQVRRRLPRHRHALPSAGRGYAAVTVVEPGMTIDAYGELAFLFNVDRRTAFGGAISPEPPSSDEPNLYFAARLFYRRASGELLETAAYRQLRYPDLAFSIVPAALAHLNYAGAVAFGAEPRRPSDAPACAEA